MADAKRAMRGSMARMEVVLLLVIVVFGAVVAIISPDFLSRFNLLNALLGIVTIGVAGLGEGFVLIGGEIDLSIGSMVGLTGVSTAVMMSHGLNPALAIICGILLGCVAGLVNGLIVVFSGVNSFVVTLGTQAVLLGVTLQVSGGFPTSTPHSFERIGSSTTVFSVPLPIIEMVILALACQLILSRGVWGRRVIAVGDNAEASRLAGIPLGLTKVSVFVVAGAFAALAGIISTASVGSADSSLGQTELLPIIAAVVIGGASLVGGRGSMIGVLLGAVLLGLVQNAYVILRLSTFWQQTTFGLVIVIAGIFDQIRQGRFKGWKRRFGRAPAIDLPVYEALPRAMATALAGPGSGAANATKPNVETSTTERLGKS
jgi:ribose/xylose/arabinose/galactoside ABC-type transport system permease subunit